MALSSSSKLLTALLFCCHAWTPGALSTSTQLGRNQGAWTPPVTTPPPAAVRHVASTIGDVLEQGPHRLVALCVAPGPSVFKVDDFLSAAECEHVMAAAESHLERSHIFVDDSSPPSPAASATAAAAASSAPAERVKHAYRTSSTAWMDMGADPVLATIQARVAAICGLRHSELKPLAEDLQVVHYHVGEHFGAHHDSGFGADKRDLTLLIYLNDVEEGGETHFPGVNLSVRPKRGMGVLFYNHHLESGEPDRSAVHQAQPVIRGERWACNIWVRAPTAPIERPANSNP
eukprot:CAMPEP_0182561448 /NCGR_PEP_ID=MMETSP1324-20130603/3924_1 /TAXON_ID=236786 /ORGANISM="Florenciella sp., Strain RCC1587" /LENGTH=288 /DNA_ID=CAMNT_0024774071 /DNA_START=220 /DNA_END=1086 /DNA_ORIENTATION=+